MAGKFFLLQQVTDFAPGYFENTAMEEEAIHLAHSSGNFLPEGTYTSPPYATEDFFNLVPSWNADTPAGTSVELQLRVSADGRWSQWFSFGQWSPFIRRYSPEKQQDDIAVVDNNALSLVEGCPAADTVQMRVHLRTQRNDKTPKVRLLAASINAASKLGQEPPAYDRLMHIPSYSSQTRDPAIAGSIASVTSLAMMMNRWGADLLPEEVARVAYDNRTGGFDNLPFICAAAAAFGFASHINYSGIAPLRREIWQGRAVAARVHYRAPVLGGADPQPRDSTPLPPVLESATHNSSGHLVVVHGFSTKNGVEYVTMSDPTAKADALVVQEIPVASFAKIYTGLAVFLQPCLPAAKRDAPKRRLASLQIEDGRLKLWDGAREILPAGLDDDKIAPATVCYTISDDIAYASAAQRRFYYPVRDESGGLPFDNPFNGRRLTIYVLGAKGENWVAEKLLEDEAPPGILPEDFLEAPAVPPASED